MWAIYSFWFGITIILYCIVFIVLYYIILYCIVLYCTVLYCPVLHCSILPLGIYPFVVNNNKTLMINLYTYMGLSLPVILYCCETWSLTLDKTFQQWRNKNKEKYTEWMKSVCAPVWDWCCTVLWVGKSHTKKYLGNMCDLCHMHIEATPNTYWNH